MQTLTIKKLYKRVRDKQNKSSSETGGGIHLNSLETRSVINILLNYIPLSMANELAIEDIYNVLINPEYIDSEGCITLSEYERESLISWIAENGYAPEPIDNKKYGEYEND